MKPLKLLVPLTLISLAPLTIDCHKAISQSLSFAETASDIIRIDQLNAQERLVELDVTPSGLIIDFGSQISSLKLTHKSNISYHGMDGVLCQGSNNNNCDGRIPTILFLEKIPRINFKDEEPLPGNYSFLYVDTASGMYRFKLKPVTKNPEYTKVEIENTVKPLFPR